MRITCPQCGFFRELPDNKIPVTSTMATCPKCRHRFKFRPDPIAPRERDGHGSDWREDTSARSEEPSSWRRREHRPVEPVPAPEPTPEPAPERPIAPAPRETARPAAPVAAPEPPEVPESVVSPASVAAAPTSVSPSPSPRVEADPLFPPEPPAAAEPAEAPAPQPAPVEPVAPVASEARPLDEPAAPPRETPAAAKPRSRRGIDKDGVRDIWAKLQAMDDGAASRKRARTAEAPEDDAATEAAPPVTDPIPWERPEGYGFFPALLLTLRQILLRPTAFFTAMPEGRPKGKALVFNLLISEFLLVIDFLWTLIGLRAGGQAELSGSLPASTGLSFLIVLLLVPPALTCGIYLDAWITHLLLLLFRNARKSFSETFRVLCYSAAPTVLSAVPVAGQILSPIILVWYMALQALGLKKIHDGSYTQILAAVFIKWSLYLFLLLAMLQSFTPGR